MSVWLREIQVKIPPSLFYQPSYFLEAKTNIQLLRNILNNHSNFACISTSATSIFASSTGRFSGALTLDSTLGVTGTSTIAGLSAGFGTFSENLVASKLLNVTGLITAAGGMTLTGTDQITDANVVDALTVSSGGAVTWSALTSYPTGCTNQFVRTIGDSLTCETVADADVVNALTISGGTVNDSIIGGTTAVAGTFTNLVSTASTTFSTTARITAQGTVYFGGSVGLGTTTPTYDLTLAASTTPLVTECRLVVTGSFTLDLSECTNASITAVGNVTLTVSNIRAGVAGSIQACQDSTGGRTWTWDNSVIRFMNASSTGITQTPNRCNVLGFKGTFATGTTPILFVIPTDAF